MTAEALIIVEENDVHLQLIGSASAVPWTAVEWRLPFIHWFFLSFLWTFNVNPKIFLFYSLHSTPIEENEMQNCFFQRVYLLNNNNNNNLFLILNKINKIITMKNFQVNLRKKRKHMLQHYKFMNFFLS